MSDTTLRKHLRRGLGSHQGLIGLALLLQPIFFAGSCQQAPEAHEDDWELLFDGGSTEEWREEGASDFPGDVWVVEDSCLKLLPNTSDGKDLISLKQYSDFELRFEWKISERGNSGVKYLVHENHSSLEEGGTKKRAVGNAVGFEFQLYDDWNVEVMDRNVSSGALYDLIAPAMNAVKRPGEFNTGRIIVKGAHVEHWINGVRILQFELDSEFLRDRIANSKFKKIPDFGKKSAGHISLQNHGDEIWFRKIRIQTL